MELIVMKQKSPVKTQGLKIKFNKVAVGGGIEPPRGS